MTTESMKPYPVYKDSGIEWIGEIPEGWDVRKLKWVVKGQLKYGANEVAELDDKEYPRYIRITDFGNDGKLKQDSFKSLPFDKARDYFLNEGDVLFARSGATVGKTFQFKNYNGLACFAGYLIKASPQTDVLSSDFLYYFTKSNTYENWKNSIFVQATIQNIGADKYNLLQVPIPNFDEQQSIATFLDNQTTKIDTLIGNKQKQIELLKEERTAIINQAVTKGLNPDVPMRDSGIEWLGEIPEHWEMRKVSRSFALIGSGTTPKSNETQYYQNGDINWIITGDLNDGLLNASSKKITSKALEDYSTLKIYPKDTIIVAMYGATIGKICLTDFEACTNQACCALSKSPYLLNRFIFYWFLANKRNIINMSYGGGQPNISQDIIRSLKITTPSIAEQHIIIAFLDKQDAKITTDIEIIQQQITLLQEYRTALISEAVTGKIDLRNEHEISTSK